jgi:hypothetical protein
VTGVTRRARGSISHSRANDLFRDKVDDLLLRLSSQLLRTQMNTTPLKLTEEERITIVNALTVAARQYEIDGESASELALHGMAVFEPARNLAKQFQDLATDARQLRDKITFLWENIQL